MRRPVVDALATALAVYAIAVVAGTPSVDHLRTAAPLQTSFMALRGERRAPAAWIELGEVSPYLVCAVVKAEDRGFFRHRGLEWPQLRKALWGRLTGGSRMGGSTITQQLARNLYLGPERSLHRKLREALIARELEAALDKRRILELYLNLVEWGDGVWGAREAARVHLGKLPGELDPFEAAFLASLLPAPRAALEGANLERARASQRRVLHQLAVAGVIDRAQYDDARGRVGGAAARGTEPPRRADLARLLADECGLAQELAASAHARRRQSRTSSM